MPKYKYFVDFSDTTSGVIEADNEADAEFLIEKEFDDGFITINNIKIEELVD